MNIKFISIIALLFLGLFVLYKYPFRNYDFSCNYRLHYKSVDNKSYYVINSLIDHQSKGQSLIQGTIHNGDDNIYINRKVSFNYQKEGFNYKFKSTGINLLPTDSVNDSPVNEGMFKSLFPEFYYENDAEINLDIYPQENGGFVIVDSATQILFCESR